MRKGYRSARFYCLGLDDGITSEDPTYSTFGQDNDLRMVRYEEFLRSFNTEEEELFSRLDNPVGDGWFIKKLLIYNGRYVPRRKGQPRKYYFCNSLTSC